MPSVSIIVPSLNQGAYIRQTIESILTQDFTDLECLVMDGGSTDETLDVLRSFQDPRLSWRSEPDRGQSQAINKGLHLAQGRILSYLNSDDLLRPGAVAAAVAFLDAHPNIELVEGDLEFISANGESLGIVPGQSFSLSILLSGSHSFNQAGAFWRHELSERIGDFDESLHYCMDLDYWARASLSGAVIAYQPGVRAAFRLHSESKTVGQMQGFLADQDAISQRLEAEHANDTAVVRMIRRSHTDAAWHNAVYFWRLGQVGQVRPQLRQVILHHSSFRRRIFALLLLADSWLPTNLAGFVLNHLGRFTPEAKWSHPLLAKNEHRPADSPASAHAPPSETDAPARPAP